MSRKPKDDVTNEAWNSMVKNYDLILGAHLSNSFEILMALSESKAPLSATEISKVIATRTNGKIFKVPATLQDSIEKRLVREGYVAIQDLADKHKYSITSQGQSLLVAWMAFLEGCS